MSHNRFEALARCWVPGEGPVAVQPWAEGVLNRTCRVVRAGRAYSLRIGAAEGRQAGLDRRWECAVRALAGEAGLAPLVHRCDPESGILIADWAPGRAWGAEETRLPGNIDVMARLLRRVHALKIPAAPRRMHPADWIALYRSALESRGPRAGSGGGSLRSADLRSASEECLARLALDPPSAAVLCHSDLHRHNLLIGAAPVLLDWEYAHVSDGLWDLAGWAANNDWSTDEAQRLLSSYLQRPARASELGRLGVWAWLYDYVCLLWSELHLAGQAGAADPDIDARAGLLAARLARPRWEAD